MNGSPDVVVVGGGIVGAACALSLSKRKFSVLLLESRFVSAGVTAAGMGHIVVMDDSEPQIALTAYSRSLWTRMAPEMPFDCENDPCGTLWIAADEEEGRALERKAALYRAHSFDAEILSPPELLGVEPNLRPGLVGALLVPEDRVLYPPNAARWLVERARDLGAQVREGCDVLSIDAQGVQLADGRVDAADVVNAAGPEAPRLTPGLPIEPRRGHLIITDRYPGFCRHQLVELGYTKSTHSRSDTGPSVAFNLQPRATGQMLLGSSREFVGWETSVNPAILDRMVKRGIDYMPSLANLSAIRAWTGLRPATRDGLPLIGRWKDSKGAGPWIAAGHEGLGITTAPGTGELLATLITGESPPIDPRPFGPTRALFPPGR